MWCILDLGDRIAMGDFINYLEQRVEHTKLALQAITEQIQKASAEREVLMADLAGYERTLSAERRIHGIDTGTPEAEVVRSYPDRKSTRLNSSHLGISYADLCL